MRRIAELIACIGLGLLAGCEKSPSDVLGEAHKAASVFSKQGSAADFDDSSAQVFPERGLVCGSRVKVGAGSGKLAQFERYYFSRSGGVALEGDNSSWLPLANDCIIAMEQRLALTNHRLAVEASAN